MRIPACVPALILLLALGLAPGACRMRRRSRLRPRSRARPQHIQGAQRLESRHAERRARSRRLVGVLPRPQARLSAQAGRDLQPDRRRRSRRLRAGARADPRGASGSVPDRDRQTTTSTRTYNGPNAGGRRRDRRRGGRGTYTTTFIPRFTGSWNLDVWGKVRRQIESNAAAAQASAADLDNAKLSAQAQLATAYFNLRAADSLHDLLARTVNEYKKTLDDRAATSSTPAFSVDRGRCRRPPKRRSSTPKRKRSMSRAARAIRTRHRHPDRPAARRTVDRAASARRQHSENSGHRSLDAARTASRHRRGGTHHAGAKRAYRRRGSRAISRHQPVRRVSVDRQPARAVQRRQRRVVARRGRHRKRCSTAGCAARKSMPRARSIGRASPITGRPCSPPSSRSRISSSPSVCSSNSSPSAESGPGRSAGRSMSLSISSAPALVAFTTVVQGGNNIAERRGGRLTDPPGPVPCQRHPDRGAWRRLGRQSPAHEKRTGEGLLACCRSFRPNEAAGRSTGIAPPTTIPQLT